MKKAGFTICALLCLLMMSSVASAQLTGPKNIPGDYADLAAAIADLNTQGVGAGGVTFNLLAGNPQTAPSGGYVIGGAGSVVLTTASASNPIVFNGNVNSITAPTTQVVGALNDAIFKLIGADWVTISGFIMLENPANTTTAAATNNMTEWGVALLYVTTTDGAQNNTIQINTIDLDRTYQNTFGIYSNSTHTATAVTVSATATGAAGGNSGLKVYGNIITDVNNGIVVVGPTAAADNNEGTDIGGVILATGNTLSNFGTTGTFSSYANVSGTVNGILVRNTRNFNVSFNTVTSSIGGVTLGTLNGVQIPAFSNAPTGTFTNSINNNTLSLRSGLAGGAMNGLNIGGTSASTTSTINVNNNDFNTFGHTVAGTAAITFITQGGTHLNHNISNNTFTNMTVNTTGSVTFISNSNSLPAGGVKNVNNNSIVTGFSKTGAGGTITGFTDNGSDPAGAVNNFNNNNFSNITATGATTVTVISSTNGGTPTKNVIGNTVSNITGGTSLVTGISTGFDAGPTTITGNTVSNITNGGSITGMTHASGAGARNISKNSVKSLNGTAAGSVVTGLAITSTTTSSNITVANNYIGNLTAAAATTANGILGINITGSALTSNFNVFYNTVYINNTTSGVGFGSSGISTLASTVATTSTLNLRNNIIVNTSVQNGAGLTVAYRRSAGAAGNLANYASTSNNNLFYAGAPSITNLIYADGTSTAQTIAAYRTGVFTAGTISPRDTFSASEAPPFLSTTSTDPTFLHINPATPTQIESGGAPIAGITDDFDGQARSVSFPDIGADEFTGIIIDGFGPNIAYTLLANTVSTGDRVLNISVTDISGVPTAGIGLPVIYYRKNAGSYVPTQCAFVSGSNYTCGIIAASLGGLAIGDVVGYYVAAQDTAGNVSVNPSTGAGGFTANPPAASTPPTTPNTYNIATAVIGTFTVPGSFPSLTNAGGIFEFINNNVVTGNVTIQITADLLAETGTVALNAYDAPNTITISPTVAPRTISGAAAATALLRFNGASRVTIDGSTSGGTDRSLTITNTSLTTPQVVRFGSIGTTPIVNDTLKNCVIVNGVNTSSAVLVIDTGGAVGGFFNNITIQNNDIQKAFIATYNFAITAAGNGSGLLITQNKIDNSGAAAIRLVGVYVQGVDGATVSQNTVGNFSNIEAENDTGIWFATATVNSTISGNTVSNLGDTTSTGAPFGIFDSAGSAASGNNITGNTVTNITTSGSSPARGITLVDSGATVQRNNVQGVINNNTGTFGANGIEINAGNNNVVKNNFVSNINHDMTGGAAFSTSFGVFGMLVASGTGHQIYNNSINLYGPHPGVANSSLLSAAFAINSTASTGMDVRDNIFANNITGGTTSIAHVSVYLPSGGTSAMNLTWNKNSYYFGTNAAQQGVGQAGTTAGTNFFTTLAALKAYSSTLSVAGTNDDASIFSTGAVPFATANDLHITSAAPEFGTAVTIPSVTNDFDGDGRPGNLASEIGADEILDTNAPDTTIDTFPPNPSTSSSATFTFSGTDTLLRLDVVASFECRLDGASFAPCTSPQNYTLLANGSHTFDVRAKDFSGNVDPTPASYTWFLDATAPDTQILTNPPDPSNSPDATFTFSGSDTLIFSVASFECKLDAGSFAPCTSPQSYLGLADGSHTFQVHAIDSAGNVDPTPASFTWVIDTIAPDTQILTNPPDPSSSADATFTFTGTDALIVSIASFECKLDAGSFAPCTSPQSYLALADGSHTFQVHAIDSAGNVDPSPASYTWTIATGPIGPVSVTATAGTTGPTAYPTVKDAFDAINAGTHQGAVTVSIVSSTTETATSVLNSNGAGAALYTSVLIRPLGDAVAVAGPSAAGGGLIELNGADNVTIDGDNPNTAGTNRNLTIQNTAANTVNFASVIRIALATTIVTSADNCTIKNLNLLGNATGRNIAAATSTGGPENTSWGVIATSGASTVSATTAPTALASVTTVIAAGATASNLRISNNSINSAARAVAVQGSAATVFPGLTIDNNLIGNATAGAVDQVYSMGVTAQGTNNAVIRGNTVYVESYLGTQIRGLEFGSISATGTTALIEKNQVLRVRNNNPGTFGAYGINLGGGNTHTVQNNFVLDVRNDQTVGTGAFSTTFGVFGIRVASGTGHKVYHNSVHLFGALPGVISTDLTAAFGVAATGQQNMDVRNNIFSNQMTGGNPTGTRHAAIFLPSGATVTMNLTLNNSDYYQGTDPLSLMAQVGTTIGTGEYLAVNFDPTMTTPATNFRAYTSPLSAAGTNDNASKKVDPLFVSNTNLHIAVASPMVDAGATVGVGSDIDGQFRVPPPDIGADEPSGITPPANDIAATAIITPAPGSIVPTGAIVSPQASFTNVGSATQTSVNVQFTITGPGGYSYTNTQSIASIAPDQTVTVTFAAAPAFTTTGAYVTGAAVTTPDSNAGNDTVSGGFTVSSPLSGTYTVGSGGDFTSLTNPGGIFDGINSLGATSNLVINITSDLTGETGAIPLNEVAGGFAVLIKPSGAARSISSSAGVSLIKLSGADNVTIDGSLAAGTDRSLTINNSLAGVIVWIATNATSGANSNTVKNCILSGPGGFAGQGIIAGSGATLGNAAEFPNSNNTIQNNAISRVQNALFASGNAATLDQNWSVVDNTAGSATVADKLSFRGFLISNSQNFTISRNVISGVNSSTGTSATMSGIQISGNINGGTVSRNVIKDIRQNNTGGWGSNGIYSTVSTTASNLLIVNNFISDVASQGFAGASSIDNGYGIMIDSGGGIQIYHNSVNMNTNQVATGSITAALNIAAAVTTAGSIDLRDNILVDTETVGTRYGVYDSSTAAIFSNIDYNDYFAQNVGFLTAARPTLPDWRTATGQDVHSLDVDPLFVSATDLHIQGASPMRNADPTGTGVLIDIDGDTRPSGSAFDIGADEIVEAGTPGTLQFSSATYSIGEAGVMATITVTRTGGSTGTVGISYATIAGGSANGGAACGGAVDYVNTSGTLSFGDTVTSQTFDIPICNDAISEPNETVNLELTLPTGGATLGSQSMATLTINDDDGPPAGTFSIDDVRTAEGNSGTHLVTFTVSFVTPGPPPGFASVQYGTGGGTATPGAASPADYMSASGTATFGSSGAKITPDGTQTTQTQTFTVVIIGDLNKEPNETFFVTLSNPNNGTILDGLGSCVIVDEDRAYVADFDRDLKTDLSVFRPSDGNWYYLQSSNGVTQYQHFGQSGDMIVPGDYDGDGVTDLAVFRPSASVWYILRSSDFAVVAVQWGLGTDLPVQGDYDGDTKTDIAVYRPSTGSWYVRRSSDLALESIQFGTAGDKVVPGDYDGDGMNDVAVFRPSTGTWYVEPSSGGAVRTINWGTATDIPVAGDFDGDGSTDIAVFRPSDGNWYISGSLNGATLGVHWGQSGDIPVVGDYDADGISDIAVWRPSTGDWYVLSSNAPAPPFAPDAPIPTFGHWGQSGDKPVPAAYVPEQ